MPNIASPNVIQPSLGSSLANTGFSKPEPGFLESAGGFGGLTSGIRNVTRNLAAGFAKDPAYRQMAAQQLAYEQQAQQEQVARIKQAVIEASFDSMGEIAERVKGIGSENLMASVSTLKLMEQAANNTRRALDAAGWQQDDIDNVIETYKLRMFSAADLPAEQSPEARKLAEFKAAFPNATEAEMKEAGFGVEPREAGTKPVYMDATLPGGKVVKNGLVSYDNGKTFQKSPTLLGGDGGGQFSGGFDQAVQFVLGQEGGYVADDAGKGETNLGINITANPDVDVKGLTRETAIPIYKERYWDRLQLDNMPPATQLVAFDAAVNQGQEYAKMLLKMSNGDPQTMLQLREMSYRKLAESPDYAQYLPTWLKRLDDIKTQLSGGQDISQYAETDTSKSGKLLSPEEATQMGLPPDRRWNLKPDNTVEQVTGTQPPEQGKADTPFKAWAQAYETEQGHPPDLAAVNDYLQKSQPKLYEGTRQKQLAEFQAGVVQDVTKTAQSATKTLRAIGEMKRIVDSGLKTGKLQESLGDIGNLLTTFNVSPDLVNEFFQTTDKQRFNKLASQMVQGVIGSLGTGFSNADRDFTERQVPQITDTKEAIVATIDYLERRAKDEVDVADKVYNAWVNEKDPVKVWLDYTRRIGADTSLSSGSTSSSAAPGKELTPDQQAEKDRLAKQFPYLFGNGE